MKTFNPVSAFILCMFTWLQGFSLTCAFKPIRYDITFLGGIIIKQMLITQQSV